MPQFVYSHLTGALGIKALVSESIVSLVASLQVYEKDDLRAATFKRFLTESYDVSTLEVSGSIFSLLLPLGVPCTWPTSAAPLVQSGRALLGLNPPGSGRALLGLNPPGSGRALLGLNPPGSISPQDLCCWPLPRQRPST